MLFKLIVWTYYKIFFAGCFVKTFTHNLIKLFSLGYVKQAFTIRWICYNQQTLIWCFKITNIGNSRFNIFFNTRFFSIGKGKLNTCRINIITLRFEINIFYY